MTLHQIAQAVSRRTENGVIGTALYTSGAPMTAQQIAAAFDLSPDTVRRYLQGATPVNSSSPQRWSAEDVRRHVVERGAEPKVQH